MESIFDLFFILTGTLGLGCLYLVCLNLRSNANVNIYLAIMLFAVSIRFILKGYLELTDNRELMMSLSRYDVFLVVLPFPYFYLKNLINKRHVFKIKDLFHFLLPILLTIEVNAHSFSSILKIDLNFATKLLITSLLIFYIIITCIFIVKKIWRKKSIVDVDKEQGTVLKKWLILFYITFLITAFKIFQDQFFMQGSQFLSENFMSWISWLTVFIVIINSPSILTVYASRLSREKENKLISFWQIKPTIKITNPKDIQLSKKINGELNAYFIQITHFVEEKHLFRKPDQTINELALKSKIPVSHLSFIFKYHSNISFPDYKKTVRILDAVSLIEEAFLKTNTLDSLSKKVGFNTYNSFYIAFKEVTGKTPQNYLIALTE